MNKLEKLKLIDRFVCQDEMREAICKPINDSGVTYCTDGNSMAWFDGQLLGKYDQYLKPGNVTGLIPSNLDDIITIDVKSAIKTLSSQLKHAPIEEACENCEGEGEVECDLGHDHDCDDCNGTGYVDSGKFSDELTIPDSLYQNRLVLNGLNYDSNKIFIALQAFKDYFQDEVKLSMDKKREYVSVLSSSDLNIMVMGLRERNQRESKLDISSAFKKTNEVK